MCILIHQNVSCTYVFIVHQLFLIRWEQTGLKLQKVLLTILSPGPSFTLARSSACITVWWMSSFFTDSWRRRLCCVLNLFGFVRNQTVIVLLFLYNYHLFIVYVWGCRCNDGNIGLAERLLLLVLNVYAEAHVSINYFLVLTISINTKRGRRWIPIEQLNPIGHYKNLTSLILEISVRAVEEVNDVMYHILMLFQLHEAKWASIHINVLLTHVL